MENITNKVAYLKGFADAVDLAKSGDEGKILKKLIEVVEDMANALDDVIDAHDELEAKVDEIDEDLADVEEVVYESDDEEQLYFIIPSSSPLPDDELIYKEKVDEIKNAIDQKLSTYERKVLSLYLKGLSYKEMGQILEKETKSIENCLSRIKSKLSYLK